MTSCFRCATTAPASPMPISRRESGSRIRERGSISCMAVGTSSHCTKHLAAPARSPKSDCRTMSEKTIRVAIVDAEPLGRRRIEQLLAREAGVEIAGQFGDGAAAVEGIRKLKPDLVFRSEEH